MTRNLKVMLGVFTASICASLAATLLLRAMVAALWLGIPAMVLSGLAVLGHLITLDDDASGGWSNPTRSKAIWYRSLAELAAKSVIFLAVLWLVLFLPT